MDHPNQSNDHQNLPSDRKALCEGHLLSIDSNSKALKGFPTKSIPLQDKLLTIDALFPFCVVGPGSNFEGLYVSPASVLISIQGEVHDYLVFFRPNKGRLVITCPSPQFLDIFLDHFRSFPFAELFCRQTSSAPFDLVVTPISLDEATKLGTVDFRWSVYLAESRGGFPNPFLMNMNVRGQKWAELFRSNFNADYAHIFPPFFLTPHILEAISWTLQFNTFWNALLDCLKIYSAAIQGINLIRISAAYCAPTPYAKGDLEFRNSAVLQLSAEKHLANTRKALAIGLDCLVHYYTENWASKSFWKVLEWAQKLGYSHDSPACQKVQFQHSLSRFDDFGSSWGF